MSFKYTPENVCAKEFDFEIEDGIIKRFDVEKGCTGNLGGIKKLIENRAVSEVADLLEGVDCRNGTSCPDQISKALKEYILGAK